MKKFVHFLAFVLIGAVSVQTAYARCDLVTAHKSSLFDSDDFLYLKREDAKGSNLVYLKCDSGFTGLFDGSGSGEKHCLDGDLVFVTESAYVGNTNNDVKSISRAGNELIQCKTSLKNDRWENLGESGIKGLPKCKDTTAKSISTKTILNTGEEVEIACTKIRESGGRKYCVGINAGDICTRTLPKKTQQAANSQATNTPEKKNAETEKPKEAPAEPKKQAEEKPKPAPEKNKNVDEPSSDYVEKEYHCAEKVYAKQSAIDSNVKKAIAACHNNNGLGNKLGIIFHKEKNIWEEQDDETKTIRVWTMTNLFCDGNNKPGADGICPEQPDNTEATQQQSAKKTPAKPKPAPAKKNKTKKCDEPGYELQGDKCVKKTDEKDEFKKMCTEFPEQIHKAGGTITLSSTLTDDDTTCKLTSNGSVNANEFSKAINAALAGSTCTNAYYGKSSGGWVSVCGLFTLIFSAEQITCDNANEEFDKEKGQCVAVNSANPEQPADNDSAGPEKPAEPDKAGTAPEEADGDLIVEFQKEANAVVDAFKTQAQKIKEALQQQAQAESPQKEDQPS